MAVFWAELVPTYLTHPLKWFSPNGYIKSGVWLTSLHKQGVVTRLSTEITCYCSTVWQEVLQVLGVNILEKCVVGFVFFLNNK